MKLSGAKKDTDNKRSATKNTGSSTGADNGMLLVKGKGRLQNETKGPMIKLNINGNQGHKIPRSPAKTSPWKRRVRRKMNRNNQSITVKDFISKDGSMVDRKRVMDLTVQQLHKLGLEMRLELQNNIRNRTFKT